MIPQNSFFVNRKRPFCDDKKGVVSVGQCEENQSMGRVCPDEEAAPEDACCGEDTLSV